MATRRSDPRLAGIPLASGAGFDLEEYHSQFRRALAQQAVRLLSAEMVVKLSEADSFSILLDPARAAKLMISRLKTLPLGVSLKAGGFRPRGRSKRERDLEKLAEVREFRDAQKRRIQLARRDTSGQTEIQVAINEALPSWPAEARAALMLKIMRKRAELRPSYAAALIAQAKYPEFPLHLIRAGRASRTVRTPQRHRIIVPTGDLEAVQEMRARKGRIPKRTHD